MKQEIQVVEYKNQMPFKTRCILARYGSLTLDEFANITGLLEAWHRPTLRRIFNELVQDGFATKRKIRGRREKTYQSVREMESKSVKMFVNSKATFYFDQDMVIFLNNEACRLQ